MSHEIAIAAHDLGKRYRRGVGGGEDSFREVIVNGVASLLRGGGGRNKTADFWALKNANFEIRRGENVGIIGLNGAGKSTLLKILSRITAPTTGEAHIHGRLGALLEVGTGFHGELTGRENVFLYGAILGMGRAEVQKKFEAIVDFSEIRDFIDTPVKRYSSGMYVRLAFSVAAHLDPDILLLDEVLAVGDFTFQRKCLDFARALEKKGSTILFVSHNMFSIKSMCPRVIYLKKGEVVFDGPTDEGLRRYEADSQLATPPWFSGESAPAVTITQISLVDETGADRSVFDFDEPMRVRVRFKTDRRVMEPDFRIAITRVDDLHMCTYTSIEDGFPIPFIEGEGELVLTTPPLKIVSDLYRLSVSVRERRHGPFVAAVLGPSFHVRHPVFADYPYGVMHESGAWTLREGELSASQEAGATSARA